jgi:hypothetical protein
LWSGIPYSGKQSCGTRGTDPSEHLSSLDQLLNPIKSYTLDLEIEKWTTASFLTYRQAG